VQVAVGVGAVALLAVGAIVLSARSDRNLVRAAVARLSSDSYADYVAGVVEQFVGGVQTVAGDRGAFARVGVSSVVIWTLDVITAIVVLRAFAAGAALSLPLLLTVGFFAVSVGNLAKVLPLSPGGIGLYEAAFTAFVVVLTPPGLGPEVAFAAGILDHAVKNVVTVVGGVLSMLGLNVSLTQAVEESAEAETVEAKLPDDD
jgi:hypothetical protein